MKPESRFIANVRRPIPDAVYGLKLNLPYTAGIPDCWFSGDEDDIWIEFKYLAKLPPMIDATDPKKKLLSKLQAAWLEARHKEGRQVAVIIGSPEGHVIFPGISWKTPISRDDFRAKAIPTSDVSQWIIAHVTKTQTGFAPPVAVNRH